MLTTDQKGAIAESAIVHEAIKHGLGVFKPLSDGERYDLVPTFVRGCSASSANGRLSAATSSSLAAIRPGEPPTVS
jgi:hypothetical protein